MKEISRQFGRYKIEGELGRGAMGIVYDAFDSDLDRRVALKTIHLDRAGAEGLVDCLRREAKSIARLEHPNIVTLYDAGECDRLYYLVLQLVDGETLSAKMAGGRALPVGQAVEYVIPLLAALGYAHDRGLVHRDVKPANVMVGSDGSVKLMDFGIARPVGTGLTTSGLIMGTPDYMSPEQILGQPADGRSDIFSVGCTFYELISGRKPFVGNDPVNVMHRIVYDHPEPLAPYLRPAFADLFAKALAKSPEERFQTCREFAACLGKSVEDVRTRRPGVTVVRWPRSLASLVKLPMVLAPLVAMAVLQEGGQVTLPSLRVPADLPRSSVGAPPPTDPPLVALSREEPIPEIVKSPRVAFRVIAPPHDQPMFVRPVITPPVAPVIAPAPVDTCDSLIVAGDEEFREGRYEGALAKYSEANRLDPRRSLVKKKLAIVMTILGRGEELVNDRGAVTRAKRPKR